MSLSAANHAVQLISRLLQTDTATEPICDFGPQKPPIPAGLDSRPLPRATPEACGVSSRQVAAFLEALRDDPTLRMHSVLLLRRGQVFCEAALRPPGHAAPPPHLFRLQKRHCAGGGPFDGRRPPRPGGSRG